MENNPKANKDIRVAATKKIWGYATGMMALALIFNPVRQNIALPALILAGAGVSTSVVWVTGGKRDDKQLPEKKIALLEERIANLETIAIGGDRDLETRLKELEAGDRQ